MVCKNCPVLMARQSQYFTCNIKKGPVILRMYYQYFTRPVNIGTIARKKTCKKKIRKVLFFKTCSFEKSPLIIASQSTDISKLIKKSCEARSSDKCPSRSHVYGFRALGRILGRKNVWFCNFQEKLKVQQFCRHFFNSVHVILSEHFI